MTAITYAPLANCIDLLLDAICVVDSEGRFVFVSAACERIFGYTPQEMIGKPMIEMVAPEDRARTLAAADEVMAGQPKLNFENRYLRKDGQVVHIMWSARWSEADQVRIAVAHDITERRQAELRHAALYSISEAAHVAEDLFALYQQIHKIISTLLPALNFSVVMYDEKNDRLSFPFHADDRGVEAELYKPLASKLCMEVVRSRQALLLNQNELKALPENLLIVNGMNVQSWLGVPLTSYKGTIGALVLRSYTATACYTEKDRDLLQFVSTQIANAIERKQLHASLQHMAKYDELTDLPNRGLLHDRLEMALARMRREKGCMSLLYLDLDKFKKVNDSLGHAAGDILLQEIAKRLKQCVRESDTVARIGGDEFVVLLEYDQLPGHSAAVAGKIRQALYEPVDIDGHTVRIMPSIGIALYPDHGDNVRQLLQYADEAMYLEKRKGNGPSNGMTSDGTSDLLEQD